MTVRTDVAGSWRPLFARRFFRRNATSLQEAPSVGAKENDGDTIAGQESRRRL
jgi:hypothetical protein